MLPNIALSASNQRLEVASTAGIVKNGDFEEPVINSLSGFAEYTAGQSFQNWTVAAGSVDLIEEIYWVPAHGGQSLDLNGSSAGTIYQDIATRSGANYSLSFALAGNLACAPVVKHMQVWWGSTSVATLSFDTAGHSTSSMGWKYYSYPVHATGTVTRLRFVSLTEGLCGPALDNVTVKA